MNDINFMDLKRQYQSIKEEIQQSITSVCEDTAFSGGQYTTIFEHEFAKYIGSKFVSGVDSGTGALFLAVKALNLKPSDEIIVPSSTFIATAWGALQNGINVKFADCDPDTWEMDPDSVKSCITDKTRCIIAVHLYGMPFDISKIKTLAKEYNLFLIEDCAQAHGAKYGDKIVGSFGNMGCFSFYPGKNLGAYGEAGAVSTDDDNYFAMINLLKNHGSSIKYQHDIVGYNMRMDGIQASILSTKLKHLNSWTQKRQSIAKRYAKELDLSLFKIQKTTPNASSVYHLYVVEVENREKFMSYMCEKGIHCGIHYPIPCHLQKVVSHLGYKKGDLPNSEHHSDHCVSLPMFPELSDDELSYVIETMNKYGDR